MSDDLKPPGGGALERLLMDAAADPALAKGLRQDPLTTAEEQGVALSSTERALLGSMDPARLETMLRAMAASGVQPPDEIDVDEVTFGIREDPLPDRIELSAGIRAEQPPAPDLQPAPMLPPPSRPSMGIRPGRKVALAAATVAVIGGAAGAVFMASAGSRPHRPATTAPQSTPDADVPDGGADGGDKKLLDPPRADPRKQTPK